jgi:hypothetical protein
LRVQTWAREDSMLSARKCAIEAGQIIQRCKIYSIITTTKVVASKFFRTSVDVDMD